MSDKVRAPSRSKLRRSFANETPMNWDVNFSMINISMLDECYQRISFHLLVSTWTKSWVIPEVLSNGGFQESSRFILLHAMRTINNGTERDTCVCRKGEGSVIRTLGGDARKALVVGRTHGGARMVAHSIADAPSLLVVKVRRRPFFREDPLIMFIMLGLYFLPSDKVEVEPCFVVAALIIRAQAQDITEKREGTMKPNFPVPIGFSSFKEATNVSPVARNRSRSPQRFGAKRQRQGAVGKGFLDGTDVVPVVAPPRSTVEATSHQVHIFVKRHCTNCKDELLSYVTFLSVNVVTV